MDGIDPRERSSALAEEADVPQASSSKPLLVSVWNCYDILGVPPNVFRTWAKRGCFRVFEDNHGRWLVAAYEEVKEFLEQHLQVRPGVRKTTTTDDEEAIVREFSRPRG